VDQLFRYWTIIGLLELKHIVSGSAFSCEQELIAAEEGDSVFICKSMVGPSASGKHKLILVLHVGEAHHH